MNAIKLTGRSRTDESKGFVKIEDDSLAAGEPGTMLVEVWRGGRSASLRLSPESVAALRAWFCALPR